MLFLLMIYSCFALNFVKKENRIIENVRICFDAIYESDLRNFSARI